MDPSKNPVDPNKSPPAYDSDDTVIDDSYLSEMIDGSYRRAVESEDKFDMGFLNNPDGALDPRHYDERDYQSHRRESFPQTHHPLRPLHSSRSSRKKHSKQGGTTPGEGSNKTPESSEVGSPLRIHSSESDTRFQQPDSPFSAQDEDDELAESSPLIQYELDSLGLGFSGEAVPLVTSHLAYHSRGEYEDLTASPPKKVQFEIGGSPANIHEESHEKRKHSHRRHHQKYEDPQRRLRLGSEMTDPRTPLMPQVLGILPDGLDLGPDVPVMADLDKDDLKSHRFADNKGYRRHKFQSKVAEDAVPNIAVLKPTKYDHQPHEIFVELDVLSGHGEHREWKETARWIKYEEDVEEGADRWGRPHVASLSFHSLINLRRLIETGVTLLDLEEKDLPGISYRVVETMVVNEMIRPEDRAMVMRALLLKHRHVNENETGWRFNLRRNTQSGSLTSLHANAVMEDKNNKNKPFASPTSIPEGLGKMSRRNSAVSRLMNDSGVDNSVTEFHNEAKTFVDLDSPGSFENGHSQHPHSPQTVVDISKLSLSNLSEEGVKWALNKENMLRRIPLGTEASVVLVGKEDKLERPILAIIRLAEGSYMPNITELPIPVRFVFVLLGPSSFDLDYKEIGRSISTLMSNRHFHEIAYKAHDRKDLLKGIHDFLDESIVLPPGDWDNELYPFDEMKEKSKILRNRKDQRRRSTIKGSIDAPDGKKPPDDGDKDGFDPLRRTKRLFGGMQNDIKRRYPRYLSDIKDGLNFQTIASIIFIYFASVSGAIAFGGILGEKTEKHIGISETLVSSAAAGIIFSLFSGQPLLIVGVTGPLLLFDESLYKICVTNDFDFLAFRFWIGMWVMLIGTVVVCFDGSFIARFFTRFVQEIFAAMIALLFIFDALNNLLQVYKEHPLQSTYGNCSSDGLDGEIMPYPNTALLSSVLCLGTFAIAYSLRSCRTSGYFTPMIRKFLGNFCVPIAIMIMVGLDYGLGELTRTEKLNVPEGLQNTKQRTSWIVDPSPIPIPMALLAIVPAFLVFILIFMETSICSLIIGKKEMKMKKGGGFHLDIFIICLINGLVSTIGGCWVCGATVRAVAHSSSLTVFSTNNPPGEKPKVLGVIEQRVSNLFISLLVGLSVLMSPALLLIPMAVLFGVFLYMGISSMDGIQFFERVSLLFKTVTNHPQVPYVRRVRTSKMHLFTVIQILCLVMLFGVKFSPIALAIPFLLILLVPLRTIGLKAIFRLSELAALDAKGLEPEEEREGSPAPPDIPLFDFGEQNLKNTGEDSSIQSMRNGRNKDFRSIW